ITVRLKPDTTGITPSARVVSGFSWTHDIGNVRPVGRRARGTRGMKKKLNIGLVGYGFMGRTHSNAFRQAPRFFDVPYEPVLKAVCARNADRVRAFASNWGY